MLGFDIPVFTPLMLVIINCFVLQPTAEDKFAVEASAPRPMAELRVGGGGVDGAGTAIAGRAIAMDAIETDLVPPDGVPGVFPGGTPGVPAGGFEEPVVVPPDFPPAPEGLEPVGLPPAGVDPPALAGWPEPVDDELVPAELLRPFFNCSSAARMAAVWGSSPLCVFLILGLFFAFQRALRYASSIS